MSILRCTQIWTYRFAANEFKTSVRFGGRFDNLSNLFWMNQGIRWLTKARYLLCSPNHWNVINVSKYPWISEQIAFIYSILSHGQTLNIKKAQLRLNKLITHPLRGLTFRRLKMKVNPIWTESKAEPTYRKVCYVMFLTYKIIEIETLIETFLIYSWTLSSICEKIHSVNEAFIHILRISL